MDIKTFKHIAAAGLVLAGAQHLFADDPNLDENGIAPKYWSTFDDGTKNSVGTGAVSWTGSSWTGDYCLSPGGKALKNTSSWGNFDEKIERPFTLTMSVRLPSYQSDQRSEWEDGERVMVALGRAGGDVVGIKNKAGFKLAAFYNNSANQTVDLVCDTAVGRSAFVRCALVCKTDNTVEFYVDGELVGTTAWDFTLNSAEFQTGGVCGAERDKAHNSYRQAIDDWRVYDEALTAAQIANIAAANKKTDENGIEPIHWYKFNGDRACTGSYDANSNGEYYPNYEDACDGKAISGQIWSDSFAPISDKFTFVTLAKTVNSGENRVIWHCGSGYSKTFGLWSNGDLVGIFTGTNDKSDEKWASDGNARLFAIAEVPNAGKVYNVYAITYADGLFSLYVNGTKVADSLEYEIDVDPTEITSQGFQVNGTYQAGVGGMSAYGGKVDDFRYYDRVLTEAQLRKINETFFVVDENGMMPWHWLKFDGNFNNSGRASLGSWDQTQTFADAADGQAIVCNSRPWYQDCVLPSESFTIVTAAKTRGNDDRIIFARGEAGNKTFGLYSHGSDVGIFLSDRRGEGFDPTWREEDGTPRLLLKTTVPGAAAVYYSYAVVYTNGIFTLYVDGVPVAETEEKIDLSGITTGGIQFGEGHGSGILGISANGADIDDFRWYTTALTEEQLLNIAETFKGFGRDELGELPTHWYKFNGNSDSSGQWNMNYTGGTWSYINAVEGQALSVSSGPWCTGAAKMPGAFTYVTVAKTKGNNEINRFIWARGWYTDKVFGLYANTSLSSDSATIGLYEMGWTDEPKTFCATTVSDAKTTYHVYAVTYDPTTKLFSLYVDGVKAAEGNESVNPADIEGGDFQFGNAAGGYVSNIWECGGDVDDFRYYDRVLTAAEMKKITETFVDPTVILQTFAFDSWIGGGAPRGWTAQWAYDHFNDNYVALGPGQVKCAYRIIHDDSVRCHPGLGLAAQPARSLALYANVSWMDANETAPQVMAGFGHVSQNAICLVRLGNMVKIATVKDGTVTLGEDGLDVTGLKGYHLFVFSYDIATGTQLSMDGGDVIYDYSDAAKVSPSEGLQLGAAWGGEVNGFKVAREMILVSTVGYDAVVTPEVIAGLVEEYPATDVVTGGNVDFQGNLLLVPTCTVADGLLFGVTNGRMTIPAGEEVSTAHVQCLNNGNEKNSAVLDVAGKLTLNAACDSKDVYSSHKGVLFGHWNGTGTYNITGELDASLAFIEMCYSALDQTMNVDGGLVKAKGIWKGSCGWAQQHTDLVTIANGGQIITTGTVGFDVALAVLGGENTVVFGETSSSAEPIALTAGSVAFEIADGKTVTRSGAITGTGTLVKTGTGTLVLSGEADATANIRLDEGQVLVPAGFAGKVSSGVKGWTAVPSAAEDGMQTYTLKQTGLSIIIR